MDIESQLHTASEIDSYPADVETLDSYEERIAHYNSHDYTYIPIPRDDKYYDTDEGWLRDISSGQMITEETHLMEVLRKLRTHPFVLVDYLGEIEYYIVQHEGRTKTFQKSLLERMTGEDSSFTMTSGDWEISSDDIDIDELSSISAFELRDNYPQIADKELPYGYSDQFGIITLVDLNKRGVKQMLYKVISELAASLSNKIEKEYPESESVFKYLRPVTIGRWRKDQINGLNMHIAEHMNLLEMMQVIQGSDDAFVNKCGFDSKNDVQTLNSINEIRKRVMHANRSLIYDRKEIDEVLEVVQDTERIISSIN